MSDPKNVNEDDGSASLSQAQTEIERLRSALVDLGRMVVDAVPQRDPDWRVPLIQFVSDNVLPPRKAGGPLEA